MTQLVFLHGPGAGGYAEALRPATSPWRNNQGPSIEPLRSSGTASGGPKDRGHEEASMSRQLGRFEEDQRPRGP